MSEAAAGLSLEDDPVQTIASDATIESPIAQVIQQDGAEDADIAEQAVEIEHKGERQRLVPAGALSKERTERKALAAKVKDLEAKVSQVDQLTATNQQLDGHLRQLMPLVQAYQARPDLFDQALGRTAPSARQSPQADAQDPVEAERLSQLAREFEFFDAEGKPDVARMRRVDGHYTTMAQREAQRAVQPLTQQSVMQKAQEHDGTINGLINQGYVSRESVQAWRKLIPTEAMANPEAASVLYYAAKGLDAERAGWKPGKGAPAAAAVPAAGRVSEPIETETVGRRPNQGQSLSTHEERFIREHGISAAKYKETISKMPAPGQPLSLED